MVCLCVCRAGKLKREAKEAEQDRPAGQGKKSKVVVCMGPGKVLYIQLYIQLYKLLTHAQ